MLLPHSLRYGTRRDVPQTASPSAVNLANVGITHDLKMNPTMSRKRPVALIILSGFGWSRDEKYNAIAQAHTPFLDKYFSKYTNTLLEASGEAVGLPDYQPGNSEVSHLIIGSGQALPLDVTRIDEAIRSGIFFENPALITAIDAAKHSTLHLMGLVSEGSVH